MKLKAWPGIIFVLFGANFAIVGVTVVAAARTASPVEPDYDARALRWDEPAQREARNMSLGWTATVVASPASGVDAEMARVRIRATLTDADGRPLRAATRVAGRIVTTPIGEPAGAEGEAFDLAHVEGGVYEGLAKLPAGRPHSEPFRLRLAVEAGFDLFTCERVVMIDSPATRTP